MTLNLESNPLRVSLAGLDLPNPAVLASGVLGFSAESFNRVAKGGAGAVVTKSIGVEPRVGYPNPTVVQAECGLINAMGLPNPGIDVYTEEIKYAKTILRIPLIVSVFRLLRRTNTHPSLKKPSKQGRTQWNLMFLAHMFK